MISQIPLKMKMPEPLEKEIQSAILEYLHRRGVFCWKQGNTGIYKPDGSGYIPVGLKGIADILGCYQGKFLAIEVKRKSGKLSADQIVFLQNVTLNGGIGFVARSIDDVVAHGL